MHEWMVANLVDDLALQMALYTRGMISDIDTSKLKKLSEHLGRAQQLGMEPLSRSAVAALLDAYSFAATKAILSTAREFTAQRNKKLLVLLLDPYRVTRPMLASRITIFFGVP